MKRAVLTGPGRFEIDETPVPSPKAGEALLRITAVGICGSDMHMFKEAVIGGIRLEEAGEPFVIGHECVGVVEEVGPDADRSLVGRRVFVEPAINCGRCRWCISGTPTVCPYHDFLGVPPYHGAYREYMPHPARLCEPLPDDVDDVNGVLLEPLAIAQHSLERAAIRGGCSAAVLGAGPIGLTHVILLARSGLAPLIVTDLRDERLECARKLGATHTFNPQRDDLNEAVKELTGDVGIDFVFECAGVPETIQQMVEIATPAGRVAAVGITSGDVMSFTHSIPRRKGLDILMIRRANLTFHRALARMRHEHLPLTEMVTHHWPLDRVQEAHELVADNGDGVIKGFINP